MVNASSFDFPLNRPYKNGPPPILGEPAQRRLNSEAPDPGPPSLWRSAVLVSPGRGVRCPQKGALFLVSIFEQPTIWNEDPWDWGGGGGTPPFFGFAPPGVLRVGGTRVLAQKWALPQVGWAPGGMGRHVPGGETGPPNPSRLPSGSPPFKKASRGGAPREGGGPPFGAPRPSARASGKKASSSRYCMDRAPQSNLRKIFPHGGPEGGSPFSKAIFW